MSRSLSFAVLSSRGWLIVSTILIAINIFLVLTLAKFAPEVKVVAQFLTPNVMNFGQLVETTDFATLATRESEKKLIDEMFIRYYVQMRHNVILDQYEMSRWWGVGGPIWLLSSPYIYSQFMAGRESVPTFLQKQGNVTTSTYITNVFRQDKSNIFTVDFDLYRWENGGLVGILSRRAVIRFDDFPSRQSFRPDMLNPYGFTVIQYKETEKKRR